MRSLAEKQNTQVLIYAADDIQINMYNLKELLGDKLVATNITTQGTSILEKLEKAYTARIDKIRDGGETSNVYSFIMGTHKMNGLGIDADYDVIGRFNRVLLDGYKGNMYTVLTSTSDVGISRFWGYCNHHIVTKCDENVSYNLNNTKQGLSLGDNFAIYKDAMNLSISKFKIYQFPLHIEQQADLILG
jgi:CheY-like chemotaxis protein